MKLSTDEPRATPNAHSLRQSLFVDVLRQFGTARLAVTGSSMLPAIWPGDVVTVARRGLAELQPGQIVLALRQGKLIAHRISSIAGDHLIMQGDSLPQCDPPIAASEILGQVVEICRHGRNIPVEPSRRRRAAASILRQSDFCTRMTLRIGRRLHRLRSAESLWAS